jgi:PrtD family type I secretion system ABC transporter
VVQAIVAAQARAPQSARSEALRDVAQLRAVFGANGVTALLDAPWLVIYLAVIWAFHPALGWGALGAAMLMLGLAWLNDRSGRAPLDQVQHDSRRAARYVEGSMRNAEVLQAMGMTGRMLQRWRVLQDDVLAQQTRASRGSGAFSVSTRLLRQGVQVGMMALGAWLVLSQAASAGVMIATTVLLGRALQPVEQVVGSWRALSDARAAYHRLTAMSAQLAAAEPGVTLPRPNGVVEVNGLSFRPPGSDRLVLVNIDFTLAPGEALALIGPSAAGKSTLARLLTGIWTPSAGKVRLDGFDITTWPRDQLGPWIGYVPQDVELFEGTVGENIARLGTLDSQAIIAAARRANAHEMIAALPQGYDTPVGERGLRLSPGQRQRVALARAVYGDVRLLVLDEPNASLDADGEIALARALSGLRAEGVTSIVVTHRPSLIAHVDKILVLDDGKVQQFGPAAEVMKSMQRQAQASLQPRAA